MSPSVSHQSWWVNVKPGDFRGVAAQQALRMRDEENNREARFVDALQRAHMSREFANHRPMIGGVVGSGWTARR